MVIVTLIVGCAYVASAGAQSVAVPFHIKGEGMFSSGLPLFPGGETTFQATGTAIRLGKYFAEGTFALGSVSISPAGAVTGTFGVSLVFVAANGDRLAFSSDGITGTFTGQVSGSGTVIVGATFDALLSPDPAQSTGRFSSVTGDSSIVLVTSADAISFISSAPGFTAPFSFTWEGEGSLVFG